MSDLLIDSNVLIDVSVEDPNWYEWSSRHLHDAVDAGRAAINPIIYSEVSVNYENEEQIDAFLPPEDYKRLELPWRAGFLAGKAYKAYRQRGGTKHAPLADFYIGAHALASGLTLVTRDVNPYRTYFPEVELIHP